NAEARRDLARAWIDLQRSPQQSEGHARLFWAHKELWELIKDDPEEAWRTILEIAAQDSSSWTLENLGAGPLEDLLVDHGSDFIGRVEALAGDPTIRVLVRHVWKNAMSDEVWARL